MKKCCLTDLSIRVKARVSRKKDACEQEHHRPKSGYFWNGADGNGDIVKNQTRGIGSTIPAVKPKLHRRHIVGVRRRREIESLVLNRGRRIVVEGVVGCGRA